MVKLIIALGLFLVSAPCMAAESVYVWSTVNKDLVQFGVPGSDEVSMVVICERGKLNIGGIVLGDPPIGSRVSLTFSGQDFATRRSVVVTECEGLCFSTPVTADDLAIKALIAGRPVRIDQGGGWWKVPGKGAAPVLLPLIKACGVARRK